METYADSELVQKLKENKLNLFSPDDFAKVFVIENRNSLRKTLQRLQKRKVITRLIRGKYQLTNVDVDDRQKANFICSPSYVSLESALSFYGILDGIPYEISSITVKKPKKYIIDKNQYTYTHIKKELYFGYQSSEGFLIAEKEKALLDWLYLLYKGLRRGSIDEFVLDTLDKKKLYTYLELFKSKPFKQFVQSHYT